MSHRGEIDGPINGPLRGLSALAVLSIALHHYDMGVPGSFVGIDVVFCNAATCDIVRNDRSIYADGSHVTTFGASLFDPLFATAFVDRSVAAPVD